MNSTHRIVSAILAILLISAIPAAAQINAAYITESINLDGRVDEPVWEQAELVDQFTQRELVEGAVPTERTEVRVLFDDDNLYIGIICFDSDPEGIVHKELNRDGNISTEDRIDLIIDTYNDRRMAYFFATNANGALCDGTLQAIGLPMANMNWNGLWDVRSHIGEYGWACFPCKPKRTRASPRLTTRWCGLKRISSSSHISVQ